MPPIPVYDSPKVAPAALPHVQYGVDTRGVNEGLAQAVSSAGKLAAVSVDAYAQERHRAVAEVVTDAETRFNATADHRLFNSDPNQGPLGLMQQRGEAAMADADPSHGNAYGAIRNARDSIASGIQDNLAKEIFLKRSESLLAEYHRTGERHVGAEREASAHATLEAAVTATFNSISLNPADEAFTEKRLAAVEGPIRATSVSRAAADSRILAVRQKATEIRLNAFLVGKDANSLEQARALYARERNSLGTGAAHYESAIATLDAQVGGVAQANAILTEAASASPGGILNVDKAKLFIEIGKLPAGPRREVVEQELRRRVTEAEAAGKQRKSEWFEQAYSAYYRGGQRLSAIPAQTLSLLRDEDPDGHHKLMSIIQGDESHARAGRQASGQDQLESFTYLMSNMAEHPEAYKGISSAEFLRDNLPELGPKLYQKALTKLTGIKTAPDKDLELSGSAEKAVTEAFASAFGEKKVDTKAWSTEHQALWPEVHDYVVRQATSYQTAHHGQRPPLEQYEKWATDRLSKVTVESGHWYSRNKTVPRVQYDKDSELNAKPLVVPDEFKTSISKRIRDRGLSEPSPETLQQLYKESLKGEN